MTYHYNNWPLIGRKSTHRHYKVFNKVTLICALLVTRGQKGANKMWPLKTVARGHGGSEPLPSTEGSGGEAYQPSTEGSGGEAGQLSTEGSGGEKVKT